MRPVTTCTPNFNTMTSIELLKTATYQCDQRMKWQQAEKSVESLMNGNLTQSRKLAKELGWGDIYDFLTKPETKNNMSETINTPRMKAAQLAALEHMTGDVWRVGCELECELTRANERIKVLNQEINKALKRQEIMDKIIKNIYHEGQANQAVQALINQHFWELV